MAVEPITWRCFHCDEVFHDRRCAASHFGADEDAAPACQIKMGGERTLLDALRRAEKDAGDATFRMLNESTEAAKAYYAQQGRHAEQNTAAEQMGYERGLRDAGLHHDHLKVAAAALEPFAERALRYVPIPGVWACADDVEIWQLARNEGMEADITVGHLRRAAEALETLSNPPKKEADHG